MRTLMLIRKRVTMVAWARYGKFKIPFWCSERPEWLSRRHVLTRRRGQGGVSNVEAATREVAGVDGVGTSNVEVQVQKAPPTWQALAA
ncbi:hypothetical protein PIB30_017040 [Stylosanthes scabra]|uniref:Uncharacterized protein n=1 Tax=Stylosanthes scabra TaxID=79078 RepID=A0ABU6R7T1_9FABA|nr:hypothetical protein [Stylosanthes scabra]